MDIKEVAGEMVKLIREGKNTQAKDRFYADGIISIEGHGGKLEGIDAIRQKNSEWAAQVSEVHAAWVSEPLVAADHFALHIRMDISCKNGFRAVMDEIAVYEVKDAKIVFEQYFFKS